VSQALPRNRASALCIDQGNLLMIELQDPTSRKRFWSLPGGLVEPLEEPKDCACRETLEETGYEITLISEDYPFDYAFKWNTQTYACQGHWFLAQLSKPKPQLVRGEADIQQTLWIPLARVSSLLGYHPPLRNHISNLIGTDLG
jgi:8-oxo-dGTP pyrophosphatase MutT (NUDIX family)